MPTKHGTKANKPDSSSALLPYEERFKNILELSAEWYWEQDENYRFTLITGASFGKTGSDPQQYVGTARWDHDAIPVGDDGSWDKHKAVLEARQPFTDFVFRRVDSQGEMRYVSTSGQPVFDGKRFTGYLGIAKDVTAGKRAEQLLRLEHMVARCVAGVDRASDALKAVIRAMCETQGWECGRYFGRDDKAGVLVMNEFWHVPSAGLDRFIEQSREISYAAGVGLVGEVFQSGQPLWVTDIGKDSRIKKGIARDAGMHGTSLFPVMSEGKPIGVFSFHSHKIREPDERLLQAVGMIGSQIGQFVRRKQAEEDLRRFRAAIDVSADLVLLVDPASMLYVDANETACRALGYSREELLAMGPHDIFPAVREDLAQLYGRLIAGDLSETTAAGWYRRKDGSRLDVESFRRAVPSAKGHVIVVVARDIGERKRAEQLLKLEHTVTRSLAEADSAPAALEAAIRAVCETEGWECGRYFRPDDKAGLMRFGVAWGMPNEAVERYIAGSRDITYAPGVGLMGRVWQSGQPLWVSDLFKDARVSQPTLARDTGMHGAFVFPVISEGKTIGVLAFNSREVREPEERLLEAIRAIGSQIGQFVQRKEAEDRIQHLATHDGLTSLPNRVMFSQLLNVAIPHARRYNRKFAVMFIDLDRFKIINDTLGHEAGDKLLQETAMRFSGCLRASDVVARLGGDEFVVLVHEVSETEQVAAIARKILSAAIKPVVLLGQECRVTASIGICMYPADAEDEQSLMKNADIAMYLAKEEGKNNFQFYSEDIKIQSLERMTLETSLRHALERDEFFLHYQAKLDLKTKEITGVEALLRWQHPDLGVVTPVQFIPIAEETGLIVSIGRWVLKTACVQNVAWRRDGLPPLCMAVNLSARQFSDDNLLRDIVTVLEESGMRPELLELELTESMVMQNPEQARRLLTAIKQMGVRIAIDDFGVGYSSLAQIKRFPIDTLKVDRSFIRDLAENAEDRAITEAIITMGKTLSLTVVAEGVETQEQQSFLSDHACDAIQGYLFSKPLPAQELILLLKQNRTAAPIGERGD